MAYLQQKKSMTISSKPPGRMFNFHTYETVTQILDEALLL